MAKLTLPTLESGYLSTDALNDALQAIEAWSDTVLTRDGNAPNAMLADLDLNGYSLLNLGESDDAGALLTYSQMQAYVDGKSSGLIRQTIQSFTATAGQTVFVLTDFTYSPNTGNLAVYRNGIRQFSPTNYVETNSSTITFGAGVSLNDKIQVVSNEFLATIALPPHQHPWSQITGVPVYTTRWATFDEITNKPATYPPSVHQHATTDIVSGPSFLDQFRGVNVQATQPTASRVGDLWLW